MEGKKDRRVGEECEVGSLGRLYCTRAWRLQGGACSSHMQLAGSLPPRLCLQLRFRPRAPVADVSFLEYLDSVMMLCRKTEMRGRA